MVMTILVTGATGRVGGQVAAQLWGTGARVRALARNPGGVAGGVAGDLTRPETLGPALTGVDAAFLVFPSVAGDAAAAALVGAVTAAVPHVVYLSAYGVPDEPDPRASADGTILGSHAHVEGLLAAAPGRATFLRASGFAANTLGWAAQIRAGDVLRWFHPDARRALVHEADLAAVAVRCLLGDVTAGGRHHLTGPEQLTQVEQLAAIGAALGRPLRFEALAPDAAVRELSGHFPAGLAEAIVVGQGAFVEAPEPMTRSSRSSPGARPGRSPSGPATTWRTSAERPVPGRNASMAAVDRAGVVGPPATDPSSAVGPLAHGGTPAGRPAPAASTRSRSVRVRAGGAS